MSWRSLSRAVRPAEGIGAVVNLDSSPKIHMYHHPFNTFPTLTATRYGCLSAAYRMPRPLNALMLYAYCIDRENHDKSRREPGMLLLDRANTSFNTSFNSHFLVHTIFREEAEMKQETADRDKYEGASGLLTRRPFEILSESARMRGQRRPRSGWTSCLRISKPGPRDATRLF